MADFDEARQATENMFAEQPEEQTENNTSSVTEATPSPQGEDLEEQMPIEQPVQQPTEQPIQQQPTVDEAANIAEAATQAAVQANAQNEQSQAQIQQLAVENEQLRQANEELQETITQQSEQQKEQIIENAMPELDMSTLAFASPEEVERMKADYAAKMRDYLMGDIRREFEPAIAYAKQGIKEREKAEVLATLRTIPELQGIDELMPQIESIIANNKYYDNMPIDEQLINAFAVARGVNAMNTPPAPEPEPPKPPTAEELMEFYRNNPEFQQMVDSDRLANIKQSQQVPPMSASSGAVNAALNIQEKPKTWEDASERTRKMFRADD